MERGDDVKYCCFEVAYKKLQGCGLIHQVEAVEDASCQLLTVPEAERMNDVLSETFGPLPLLAPVRKFKRQPSGQYVSKEVQGFGKRQAANARERHRIQTINGGFSKLRSIVPLISKDRKPSKVHVLRAASEYIRLLHVVLQESGGQDLVDCNSDAQLPNFGESQLLVNSALPGNDIDKPPDQVDDTGSQLEPAAYENECNIWDNHIMPFLGIVQLQDGSLIFQANEGSSSNVAFRLSVE